MLLGLVHPLTPLQRGIAILRKMSSLFCENKNKCLYTGLQKHAVEYSPLEGGEGDVNKQKLYLYFYAQQYTSIQSGIKRIST